MRPVCLLWIVLAALPLQAQEVPSLKLRLKEMVAVASQRAVPIKLPAECDRQGNIYIQAYVPPYLPPFPVIKISREGKVQASISPLALPEFSDAGFDPFAVDLRGNLYWVVYQSKKYKNKPEEYGEVSLVVFDEKGKYDSLIRLDNSLAPRQLAVFPSGEFLISGERLDEKQHGTGQPLTAIFDRAGRLVKELGLPDDIEEQREDLEAADAPPPESYTGSEQHPAPKPQGQAEPTPSNPLPPKTEGFQLALSRGKAVAADDGNIYLMRAISPPVIYVIAPGGSVARRLSLKPPDPYAMPLEMKVAGGRVAMMFVTPDGRGRLTKHTLVIANAETGEVIAHYPTGPEVGGALACYAPDAITFISTTQDGSMVLAVTHPY